MVMKFKLNTFFILLLDGDKCSAASSKETAHRTSYNMVMIDWKFLPSGNQAHM